MKLACIIATAGCRPRELAAAVASAAAQTVPLEIVVVLDGTDAEVPAPARAVRTPHRLGPPGARNAGLRATDADLLFFLDDDAAFATAEEVARAAPLFRRDPGLGIASFRIVDPEGLPPQRRHVPRLRAGDPARSSGVTTFLEGACAIRREVFDRAGPYAEEFEFGHEGTDLAWRALDRGFAVFYAADVVVYHPASPPDRHEGFHRLTARNRVLLARRRLPAPLAILYVLVWLALGVARAPSMRARREYLAGLADGVRARAGERRPISWRTAWRMARLGRPPIV